ncbi:MAG: hypothetical protein ABL879_15420 [Devosia sp.]
MRNPFKKREAPVVTAPPVPSNKKLALINVHDYPRTRYSAYWEIGVSNTAPFKWLARLISYDTHAELDVGVGEALSEEEARRMSQGWVLTYIEGYRRAEVLP